MRAASPTTRPGHVDPEPLLWLREAFTLTEAQARRRPLAYRAWYGLPERIAVTLTAIAGKSPRPDDVGRSVLAAASDVLTAVAEPNRQNARPPDTRWAVRRHG